MGHLTTRITLTACIAVGALICVSLACVLLNGETEEFLAGIFGLIMLLAVVSNGLRFIWRTK